ncbi:hypothetical protein BBJ28_00003413 [Nothophytophthora sp. Chile5]|nr:hypothetical protein BBJ28_00003413 [Nothophytophthora sp. Chile5]
MMALSFKHGINLFDNAECYGDGQAEENMGSAVQRGIANGDWSREDLVITTKIFFGSKGATSGPNDLGLSRKHIVEGTKASLERLQLEYVDMIYCHRPESFTPMEEVVRAMNFVLKRGWALYWGTSQWTSVDILEACAIADRLHLVRPVVEQPEYNLFQRSKVEFEFADLYKKYKLGLTTWGPLSSGTLTGKYSGGTPKGSRLEDPRVQIIVPNFVDLAARAEKLKPIAEALNCSMAQLAIAWCLTNEHVTTLLLGASTPEQLEHNLKALEMVEKITPEIKLEMEKLVPFVPQLPKPDSLATMRARYLKGV